MRVGTSLVFGVAIAVFLLPVGCARKLPPAERVQATNVTALRTAVGGGTSETATATAAVAEPTGWATLKGTFK